MPFTRIFGTSGTIAGTGGNSSFSHSTSSNEALTFISYGNIPNGYWIGDRDGTETHTHSFSQLVGGARIEFNATNTGEPTFIVLDGVLLDLNAAVAAGDATFSDGDGEYTLTSTGGFVGVVDGPLTNSGFITLNIPFTTLKIEGTNNGGLTNGSVYALSVETDPPVPPCFLPGTRILTRRGEVAVEDLSAGDLVETRDRGSQPILWIGSTKFEDIDPVRAKSLRPIRIRPDALGPGMPIRTLTVSRQHRFLFASKIAERLFSKSEVLVPACKLLPLPGVEEVTDLSSVTYVHILFARHEVIWANGAMTESLFLGPQTLKSLGQSARAEIVALRPDLDHAATARHPRPRADTGKMVKQLVARHAKHGTPLVAPSTIL